MLNIKNINQIKGYRFGITNQWELYNIVADDFDDKYIFQFKRPLPGNVAEFDEIILNRVAEYNKVVCKMVYFLNGACFTIDYLRDITKVRDLLSEMVGDK